MKSYNDLGKWIEKKDRKINISHEKKDRDALRKVLEKLSIEQQEIIEDIHYIDYLIDLINHPNPGKVKGSPNYFGEYLSFKSWLKELKKALKEINMKPKGEITEEELGFLKKEKARLQAEKERVEKHLTEIDKIIAKTTIMLIDLEETYCRDLSNGRSIAAVGEVILEHTGKRLDDGYSIGRWKIINLFEKHFKIKRREAVKLFDLVKDAGVVVYNVDIPGDNLENVNFYTPYMGEYMDEAGIVDMPVYGYWMVNA
ncbi:MAG: hypothetical protein GXO89_00325 [Chlorobi bacterium]|nr:hypothetical protein [Chlorobiota bacterium]